MRKGQRKSLLVMFDYDGTLAPIEPRPEMARLSKARRKTLASLCRVPGLAVAVVTGRSLPEIRKLVDVPGLIIAANHGFEIRSKGKTFYPRGSGCIRHMNKLAEEMGAVFEGTPGVIVESKGFSVAVHYRLAPRGRFSEIERAVRRASLPFRRRFGWKITGGKRVWEVRPAAHWNKGDAALWIWRRLAPGAEAVYIGDDVTDEDAFRAIGKSGTTAVVGRRSKTRAAFAIPSVDGVWALIKRLLV